MRIDAEAATSPEAGDAAARHRPVIFPFGAHEQHGPHLPLSTDTIMSGEVARRVADALDAWLLPALPYGYTWVNQGFPGTLSLSFDTVRAIAVDLCTNLARSGFTSLIVINGDFGNQAPLHQAARDVGPGFPVLVLDYPGLDQAAAQVCDTTPAGRGFYHADEVETSIVLAMRPELVHMDRAVVSYPRMPDTIGTTPIPVERLSPSGVFGDPRPATAAKGNLLLQLLADRCTLVAKAFLAGLSG
jgi:creatinine amidohydrolase